MKQILSTARGALLAVAILVSLVALGQPTPVHAQPYRVGDIVGDFALQNRLRWTNDAGRVFQPGESLRLTDFAGKIVFLEFFAVW